MSDSLLFRREVLDARNGQWLGSIRIGRNPGFVRVALVSMVLAGALVAFATWGEVTRKARVPGLLLPMDGVLNLSVQVAGTVIERRVQEGQAVTAGDVIAVIDTDHTSSSGHRSANAALSLAQRRTTLDSEKGLRKLQANQRQQALRDRIRALDLEVQGAEAETELADRRAELAHKTVERHQQLAREGFISDLQAQAKNEDWLDQQARAQSMRRNLAALQRERLTARADLEGILTQWRADETQIDRSLASLEQEANENSARARLLITAPRSGTVTAIHVPIGGAVQIGQIFATVIPAEPHSQPTLEAQLFATSRTAGFIRPGQKVWLRYEAYPYQKFGMALGTVQAISDTPVNAQELPPGQSQALMAAAQSTAPMYRISVVLENQNIWTQGRKQGLRAGMALEADVLQESRKIWEWVLEPLFAVTAKT